MPAAPPTDCTMRAMISNWIEGAESAGETARDERGEPDQQDRTPAEVVGQRAIGEIGDGIGEDRQAERQLHDTGRDREARLDRRQRRQEDLQRERRERGDAGQRAP